MKMSAIDKSWNPDTGNLKWSVGQDKYHAKCNPQLTSVTCTKNGKELGTYKIKDSRDGYSLIDKDNKVHVVKGGGTLVELIIQTCSGVKPTMRSLASSDKFISSNKQTTAANKSNPSFFVFEINGKSVTVKHNTRNEWDILIDRKNVGTLLVQHEPAKMGLGEAWTVDIKTSSGVKKGFRHASLKTAIKNTTESYVGKRNFEIDSKDIEMSKLRAYQTTAATKKIGGAFFKAPKHASIYREVLTNLKKLLSGAKWETNEPVQYPDKNDPNDNAWDSSINYKGVVINLDDGRYNYIIYELASKMKKAYEDLEDALEDVDIYVSFPYEDNSAKTAVATKKLIEESAKIKKVMNEVQTALVKAIRMTKK